MDFSKKQTIQAQKEYRTILSKLGFKVWKKASQLVDLLGYSDRDKALVELERAKQSFIYRTREEVVLTRCREQLREAEHAFIEGDYSTCRDLAGKVLRRIQVSSTTGFNPVFIGRLLRQRYPERFRNGLDKRFLVLQAVAHVQSCNDSRVFTVEQVRTVFRKGFEPSVFEELEPVIVDLVENHTGISRVENTVGQNLYRMDDELTELI